MVYLNIKTHHILPSAGTMHLEKFFIIIDGSRLKNYSSIPVNSHLICYMICRDGSFFQAQSILTGQLLCWLILLDYNIRLLCHWNPSMVILILLIRLNVPFMIISGLSLIHEMAVVINNISIISTGARVVLIDLRSFY